ncbi:hypothetical protein ACSILG_000945 [Yersinia enterocolitica]|uniref:hypothetical protein n=1 Tax=Yersinia enterocolitica TaxID=630 RepID=UPI0029A5D733|nr:hypothetical protein [Yersinia enterocolitica]HEI6834836.1 hypothetical protein [Yersinia enterocolitica]HEN3560608.1 hypothetical protein [Yersinia enterocolitica]
MINNEKVVLRKDIILKCWELTQLVAKSNAENAWKVRMWGFTIWATLQAFSFQNDDLSVKFLAIFILFPLAIFEFGIRVVEYKMIERSHKIEDSLNTLLLDDNFEPPISGVRIDITEMSRDDFKLIISRKRWLVWGPYGALGLFSLIALVC